MSSPLSRKRASPIKYLENRSPRLNPILEEDNYEPGYSHSSRQLDSSNHILIDKLKNYAEQSHRNIIENSRLSRENQILRQAEYIGLEAAHREIILKDAEIEKLTTNISLLKDHYDRDVERYMIENKSLKNQLVSLEQKSIEQAHRIQEKYQRMIGEDLDMAKQSYLDDLTKVMTVLDSTKSLLAEKQIQLQQLTLVANSISKEYNLNLESMISQNNILRNKLIALEKKKQNEIKNEEQRRELQKSRTNGIMSHCKESSAFMDKQIKRLATELLEKNISIETFTKDILKLQKSLSDKQKKYETKIRKLEDEKKKEVKQFEKLIAHMSKMHKQESDYLKTRELQVRERLSSIEEDNINLKRQIQHLNSVITIKQNQIGQAKNKVKELHEDHTKTVDKLMTDSRKLRKSIRSFTETPSFRQIPRTSSIPQQSAAQENLETVLEQHSHINEPSKADNSIQQIKFQESEGGENIQNSQEENNLDVLVKHYEVKILQIQNDRQLKLRLAQQQIDDLKYNLETKQKQTLQILQKFTPLMQLKINTKPLEEQRKQKIEQHLKSDLDLLDVMLDKYQIRYLPNV